MGSTNWFHLTVDEILRETEKAFLLRIGDEDVWIPFSQIADHEDYQVGECGVGMSVSEWIAEQKGLL